MALTAWEIQQFINEAKNTEEALNSKIGDMASFIAGKLKSGHVPEYILKRLKRELRDYNIHTGLWRKS